MSIHQYLRKIFEKIPSQRKHEDIRRYLSQKKELVEMKLTLEDVSHLKGSRKVILIDVPLRKDDASTNGLTH